VAHSKRLKNNKQKITILLKPYVIIAYTNSKDMNSKTVLSKIMSILNLEEEVTFTYAKLKDGTIVESKTFDVGEAVEVVAEDGTKTPAPDGTHELSLKDSEGVETLIKVITKDGIIVERENVELADVPVEKIPQSGNEDKENVMPDSEGQVKDGTQGSVKAAEETVTEEPIPQDETPIGEGAEEEMNLTKLAYRIAEMEKKIAKMEEAMVPPTDEEVVEEEEGMEMKKEEEEKLPKLDGAPTEAAQKFSSQTNNKNYGKSKADFQSTFLSKLYK
jgi:hypothetical protein